MIGSIDEECDISVYLKHDEVKKLKTQTLEGVLIKIRHPKLQGKVYLSVDDKKKTYQGCGIGVEDKNYWGKKEGFEVGLFMGSEFYQELEERGVVGLRQRMRDGSKVHIYDISRRDEMEKAHVEHLEHYRDNKEKLHPALG